MQDNGAVDFYDLLQISPNAEPETIHRVYRLLAQRYHPDNRDTGNDDRFRALNTAYSILSDPAKRAQYDLTYHAQRQERWRVVSANAKAETEYEMEHITRLTLLEVLYANRRTDPSSPGVFVMDLEILTGKPREHLEFTVWYLVQKRLIQRGDNSRLLITADGVDFLEQSNRTYRQRQLPAAAEPRS